MLSIPFAFVDAFTPYPFAGNTAGVVTAADGLAPDQMQRIARELGQTETCFVSRATEPGQDFGLRWFTPTIEVDLCGHATVAAFVCLAAEDRVPWVSDRARVCCATRTAAIDVCLDRLAVGAPLVSLSVGVTSLELAPDDRAAVAGAIGLTESALDPSLPLAADQSGARLLVPVARLTDLLGLVPDSAGMVGYGEQTGYRRFTLVCRETIAADCFVHLRHFAPANGIPEDPVTGTAHAVAAVYLDREGQLPSGAQVTLMGEQGHALDRRGKVIVDVRRQDGRITDVRIGGSGVIVARGTMVQPEEPTPYV